MQKNRTKKSNGNEIFGMAPKLILSGVLPSEFKMSAGTWIFSFPFKNYFYVHKNVKELISAKFWYKENVKYGCKQKKVFKPLNSKACSVFSIRDRLRFFRDSNIFISDRFFLKEVTKFTFLFSPLIYIMRGICPFCLHAAFVKSLNLCRIIEKMAFSLKASFRT